MRSGIAFALTHFHLTGACAAAKASDRKPLMAVPDTTVMDFFLSATTNLGRGVFVSSARFSSDVSYDEMCLGTRWDDVIGVVPEPASALLVALGAGLLALRRRRLF